MPAGCPLLAVILPALTAKIFHRNCLPLAHFVCCQRVSPLKLPLQPCISSPEHSTVHTRIQQPHLSLANIETLRNFYQYQSRHRENAERARHLHRAPP